MKSLIVVALAGCAVLAGCASTGATQSASQAARTERCRVTTEQEIASPTVSNRPRLTPAEKEDYFHHFLENRPSGTIDLRFVEIGCNTAVDAGLYTFAFAKTGAVVSGRYSYTYRWDGSRWLITSHHSSVMPETK
jgi:hypothetical protein